MDKPILQVGSKLKLVAADGGYWTEFIGNVHTVESSLLYCLFDNDASEQLFSSGTLTELYNKLVQETERSNLKWEIVE